MKMEAIALVALVAGLAVGAAAGFVARSRWANQSIKVATEKAARIVADARNQQKDLILEAKEAKIRLQAEAEDEARSRRTELATMERRLIQRDEQLDQRSDMLEQRDRKLLEREIELDRQREEVAKLNAERVVALEKLSSLSADDAKAMLLDAVRDEA
ncbi:MAG TPA: Rnase Y domain-containing protein [Candidatus Limnocylindrales bacterium]|nr:Rnase Y domain-containing protein [Candidatus Limnocylindrales bacterium]